MNLFEKYKKEVEPKLIEELSIKNKMAVPKVVKIVINTGTGEALKDKGAIAKISADLETITGQKPKVTKAKISVAGFNIRAGMPVGLAVTLRGKRMYDFLEKLITIVLPRLRDFRGVSNKSFDKNGNYTLGIVEHTVFPEIDLAKVEKTRGLEVVIVTSANNPDEGKKLLELLGMPFEKETEIRK